MLAPLAPRAAEMPGLQSQKRSNSGRCRKSSRRRQHILGSTKSRSRQSPRRPGPPMRAATRRRRWPACATRRTARTGRRSTSSRPAGSCRPESFSGDMLMEAGQPAAALVAYEGSFRRDPNRFRGLYGAARAADASGDRAKAMSYARKLLDMGECGGHAAAGAGVGPGASRDSTRLARSVSSPVAGRTPPAAEDRGGLVRKPGTSHRRRAKVVSKLAGADVWCECQLRVGSSHEGLPRSSQLNCHGDRCRRKH